MANLTSQQVNELANYFLAMAQTIGDYRYQNFDNLLKPQNQEIKDLHEAICEYADNLFTLSATLVLDDVKTSLSSIADVTKQMKKTYKTLHDVQKAINIAASVVTLGEAILNKNPQAIADSLKAIVN